MHDCGTGHHREARRARALLHQATYPHSYPHCWRHKTPVIFRATPQWFISMEQPWFAREYALRDIKQVRWTPAWGDQRITGMIENRPDWCISRQRTWGVPITLFTHRETGRSIRAPRELIAQVAARVERDGIDAWFALDPAGAAGRGSRAATRKSRTSWTSGRLGPVVRVRGRMRRDFSAPVDLYLEGSDQHRGWFHSSLLMSEALYARAPYRGVLTHGFTVDEKGRKMSKSLGNGSRRRRSSARSAPTCCGSGSRPPTMPTR